MIAARDQRDTDDSRVTAGHDPADAGFALPDAESPDAAAPDAEGPDAGRGAARAEAADSGGNPDGAVDQRILFIKNLTSHTPGMESMADW